MDPVLKCIKLSSCVRKLQGSTSRYENDTLTLSYTWVALGISWFEPMLRQCHGYNTMSARTLSKRNGISCKLLRFPTARREKQRSCRLRILNVAQ